MSRTDPVEEVWYQTLNLEELDGFPSFPPAPPFPPWEEGCLHKTKGFLLCPHEPHVGLSTDEEYTVDYIPVIFAVFCVGVLSSLVLFYICWRRREKRGDVSILEEYLTPSSTYQSIHTSSTFNIIKSFSQDSFKYQCQSPSGLFSIQSYPIYEEVQSRPRYRCRADQQTFPGETFPCLLDSTEFPDYSYAGETLLPASLLPSRPIILRPKDSFKPNSILQPYRDSFKPPLILQPYRDPLKPHSTPNSTLLPSMDPLKPPTTLQPSTDPFKPPLTFQPSSDPP